MIEEKERNEDPFYFFSCSYFFSSFFVSDCFFPPFCLSNVSYSSRCTRKIEETISLIVRNRVFLLDDISEKIIQANLAHRFYQSDFET